MRILRLGPPQVDRLLGSPDLFDHPADPAAAAAYLADTANVFLLAIEGRRSVGFLRATALRQPHTRRPQMFLYEIAVAPDCRRRGIARALIEQLLRLCRSRGFEEVFVFTSPHNRPAVRLYRTTGAVTETPADRMFVYPLRRARGKPPRLRPQPRPTSGRPRRN